MTKTKPAAAPVAIPATDPCRNCVLLLVAGASVVVALGSDDVVDVGRVMVESVEELTVFVIVEDEVCVVRELD